MKIEKVIHSSNDEPMYLDFWPIVSKIWRVKFGVEPILLYFGDKKIDEQYGTVVKMEILKEIPDYSQCLFSRYWYPTNEKNTTFMISDIDMLPISKWYFFEQIENVPDDKYVHLNYSPIQPKYFASCYHVAKGYMFDKILELNNSWYDFMNTGIWKIDSYRHGLSEIDKSFDFWGSDESWASEKLSKYDQNQIVKFTRSSNFKTARIDRSDWSWSSDTIHKYYDCHSIRPYQSHKEEIDNLTNSIMNLK